MGEKPTSSTPPSGALSGLTAHVDSVKARYREVEELFKDFPISPIRATEFKKFLEDHLSELAMRYVVMGRFIPPIDPDGGAEPAPPDKSPNGPGGWSVSTGSTEKTIPDGIDPALAASPAVQAAMAAGLNLLGDDDIDDDGAPIRRSDKT